MLMQRQLVLTKQEHCVIRILPGPDQGFRPTITWPVTLDDKLMMLEKVMLPMCRMLPSCLDVQLIMQRPQQPKLGSIGWGMYSMAFKEFCDTYAMGIRPLRWESNGRMPRQKPIITMTLREGEHWPERNSQTAQWAEAAYRLRAEGFAVVIVRDARQVDKGAPELCKGIPEARGVSKDLFSRALLYQQSDLNLGINNGPMWLCMALDAPTVMLRPITETTCDAHTYKAMAYFGVHKDQQMKGAPPHQQLVWQDDSADNIVAAAKSFFQQSAVAA